MKVLGLDPGSRHFGWGVVARTGTRLQHLAHGVVDVADLGTLGLRLVAIERALQEVIETYAPSCASIESTFFAKDAQAAAKLGHARGVGLLVCARAEVPTFEYAPTLVKRTVTGSGRADKVQMAKTVRVLLQLAEAPRSDAADALAVGITHLQQVPALAAARRAAELRSGGAAAALAYLVSSGRSAKHKPRTRTV